jgi:hypothetical protein
MCGLSRQQIGWACDQGDGTFDHDWRYVSDWGGDPEVISGTFDCSFKRCEQCGEEAPLEPGEVVRGMYDPDDGL